MRIKFRLPPEEAQTRLSSDLNLKQLISQLKGRTITYQDAPLISFGSGNQFGDITCGDIVGGDKITLNIDLGDPTTRTRYEKQLKKRQTILDTVQLMWIDRGLERTLAEVLWIDRGFAEVPKEVHNRQDDEERKPATINRGLSTLRRFGEWLVAEQLMRENTAKGVRDLPLEEHGPRSLPDDAVDAVLRAVQAEEEKRVAGAARLRRPALAGGVRCASARSRSGLRGVQKLHGVYGRRR
jgi:hypothetical protein